MKHRDKIIRYLTHARRRMAARGVSERQVEQAIYHYDVKGPAKRKPRSGGESLRYEKTISRRHRLGVIVEEHPGTIWVITVFFR